MSKTVSLPRSRGMRASRALHLALLSTVATCAPAILLAQSPSNPVALPAIEVTGGTTTTGREVGRPEVAERYQLPQQSTGISAEKLADTVNVKDPEDAVKYFPSLFVRKRNDGDNQSVLATRSWGLNSSARTLIFADDVLLTTLIGNNNSAASPHWNLVSPEAIERVDFLSGPYSAAYSGNSIGGVLLITTKLPDGPTQSAKQTVSVQPFSQYATRGTYVTNQTSATLGDRLGPFAWFLSVNYQDAFSQPLNYQQNATFPAGTTGAAPALTRVGLPGNVVGVNSILHTRQLATNLKLAYDIDTWLRATYTLGYWRNDQASNPQTYLTSTATGLPTFGAVSGFAGGRNDVEQQHLSQAVSLKSNLKGEFDFDVSASRYDYLTDIQRSPFSVTPTGVGFTNIGRVQRQDGTNWGLFDAKGIWRPNNGESNHEVSFGVHGTRVALNNPTYQANIFNSGPDNGNGRLYTVGAGITNTGALWLQDAWKFLPGWKLTVGGRLEDWSATRGVNLNTITNNSVTSPSVGAILSTTVVNQPKVSSSNFSPKFSLSWQAQPDFDITTSFAQAYRYPTVGELYQIVQSGNQFATPNPNLTPERVDSGEVVFEKRFDKARTKLTFFHENVRNALISQTNSVPLGNSLVSVTSVTNVGEIRNRGFEWSNQLDDVGIKGLQFFGSLTYVDSKIISNPLYTGTDPITGVRDSTIGRRVPNIPLWRSSFGFTYQTDNNLTWTVGARYSARQFATLNNRDVIPNVYQAFDSFLVVDTRLSYKPNENVTINLGIDNINNESYFLFHPFPRRTYVADIKIKF